jgi:hypothetical protein
MAKEAAATGLCSVTLTKDKKPEVNAISLTGVLATSACSIDRT